MLSTSSYNFFQRLIRFLSEDFLKHCSCNFLSTNVHNFFLKFVSSIVLLDVNSYQLLLFFSKTSMKFFIYRLMQFLSEDYFQDGFQSINITIYKLMTQNFNTSFNVGHLTLFSSSLHNFLQKHCFLRWSLFNVI